MPELIEFQILVQWYLTNYIIHVIFSVIFKVFSNVLCLFQQPSITAVPLALLQRNCSDMQASAFISSFGRLTMESHHFWKIKTGITDFINIFARDLNLWWHSHNIRNSNTIKMVLFPIGNLFSVARIHSVLVFIAQPA